MNVLFLVPPYRTTDALNIIRYPLPYGPVLLCTILKTAGHDVVLKDFLLPNQCTSTPAPASFAGKKGPRYAHYGETLEDCFAWLDKNLSWADVVCLDVCQCNVWEAGVEIAKFVKAKGLPLVIGGPYVTTSPEEVLSMTGADIAGVGEGETIILDAVEKAKSGWKGIIRANPVEDLHAIPVPDWSFAPPSDYPKMGGKVRGVLCVSRGCPWLCTFCSVHTIMGRRHRRLKRERIVEELEALIAHGVEYVCFLDDNLFISKPAIDAVLGAIDDCKAKHPKWARGAKFYAEEGVEVRIAAIPGVMQRIKDAGFQLITLGMETYNDSRREQIKKPYTREQLEIAVKNCKDAGFIPRAFYIVGLPGDTPESSAVDLIGFAKLGIEARTNNLKLYPGTESEKYFRELGLLENYDWRLSAHWTPDLPEMPYKEVRALRGYLKGIGASSGEFGFNLIDDSLTQIQERFADRKYELTIDEEQKTVSIVGNMYRAGPLAHIAEILCLRLGARGAKVARSERAVVATPTSKPTTRMQRAIINALAEHGVVKEFAREEVVPSFVGTTQGKNKATAGRYAMKGGTLKKVRSWRR